nr:uncharacterized protein LOC106685350 [Halyomorpha halys]
MERFSDLDLLIRVVALLIRIAKHASAKETITVGPITAEECSAAKLRCVHLIQRDMPTRELSQLSPFFDEVGIIRVGGRLHEAPLTNLEKHPILLPRKAHFSRLLVDHIHRRNFHAGPSLTLSLLRNEFWIPSALRLIRSRIQSCVKCRIRKEKPLNPLMASLPKARLTPCRAFLQVGLDYAGPFSIKDSNRRKATISKAYLCLFICLSTWALHLEAVSSLSTSSFLAALDRFTSRRGFPHSIWSDHGTNFIGASRYHKDIYKHIARQEDEIIRHLSPKGVEWKFIPPHFGGSWEACVKSAKSLLAGVMGPQPLTFEELATAFIRIDGVLNSRPITPMNEDPENFDVLTPAHFLIGTSLAALPEASDELSPRRAID